MLKVQKKVLSPKEEKEELKKKWSKRTKKLKAQLPATWKVLFIHDHEEYKDKSQLLSDVLAGRSMHLPTLEKIEGWAKKLKK